MSASSQKLWFFKKLYYLSKAGIPMRRVLLGMGETDPKLAAKTVPIIDGLDRGMDFVDAVQLSFHLSDTEVSLLQAAQTTGSITPVLNELVAYGEKNALFKKEVNRALMKPMITFSIAIGVLVMVTTVVVPKILGSLPIKTKPFLITLLEGIGHFMPYAIGSVLIAAFAMIFIYSVNAALFWRIVFEIPIVGKVKKFDAIYSYFLSLSLLCGGGVRMIDAMRLVAKNADAYFNSILNEAVSEILQGDSMKDVYERTGLFPFYIVEIVDTAERSGDFSKYFGEASELAEADFQESKSKLLPIVEMLVLLTVAAVIIITILSVLLPIQQMGEGVFSGKPM